MLQVGACLRQLFDVVCQLWRHGAEQAGHLLRQGVFAAADVADVKVDEDVRDIPGRAAEFDIVFITLRNIQKTAAAEMLLRAVGKADVDLVAEDVGKAVVPARRADKAPALALLPALGQSIYVTEKMLRFNGAKGKQFSHGDPSFTLIIASFAEKYNHSPEKYIGMQSGGCYNILRADT